MPSERGAGQMLDGLDVITDLVADHAGGADLCEGARRRNLIGAAVSGAFGAGDRAASTP